MCNDIYIIYCILLAATAYTRVEPQNNVLTTLSILEIRIPTHVHFVIHMYILHT